ncbi:MAG: 50S ribosomal protein L11 [Candidatus Paceibacterota bacterium]
MAQLERTMKLQIPAGQANPAPPIGPALGQVGVNIGEFVTRFNEATADMGGDLIPVVISVFDDRSFELEFKSPPASSLILKKAGIKSGAADILNEVAGSITRAQVREISEQKFDDLSANDLEAADKIIMGTCRSMGIEVK